MPPSGSWRSWASLRLAGVIVSHIIVLFDYIEDACERGETLHRAVIDSALVRLRPVLVTVLATVGGLIPLAIEGGPLWQPMCYVQITGLLCATLVTKVIVPVLYVMFVENLGWIRWEPEKKFEPAASRQHPGRPTREQCRPRRPPDTACRRNPIWSAHDCRRFLSPSFGSRKRRDGKRTKARKR